MARAASLQRGKTPRTNVLNMILTNQMGGGLQLYWRFRECEVTLHCYHSQVHSGDCEWFTVVSLFNGISTFGGYLRPKQSWKNSGGTVELITRRIKGFIPFPKGICSKMNVIARLGFELAYYVSAVQRLNHYTSSTPLCVCACVCVFVCMAGECR